MDAYIGQIILFTGNFAPSGWFTCEGQSLAINQYQAMFSILGTTYGGDGVTTFKLPDLRGAFPTQCTNISSSHPGGTYSFGQIGGSQSTVITALNMPPHTHTIVKGSGTNLTGSASGSISASTNVGTSTTPTATANVLGVIEDVDGSGTPKLYNAGPGTVQLAGSSSSTLNFDPTGLTLTPWGSGPSPIPTTPNYVAMQYCIAWQGEYPSRP